jgi:two-component sensor histidine kinase
LTREESIGFGWLDAFHPDDRDVARRAWSEAERTGRLDLEGRICRASTEEYHWFQTRALPVRDESGSIIEWLGTSTDIHDLRELQQRQQVLVAELQHRTRNLMGVVRSMSEKTARASVDLPDFRARFRDRLAALSRVQGLLSRLNDHDRVTFDELIDAELTALNGTAERVRLRGPAGVRLRSSTVQTLALALHELATNAAKYGALGQPEGLLEIAWSLEPNGAGNAPWLHIDWRESQVVMPAAATRSAGGGQGRELIERALPYQLSARTTFELGPDGVHCTISLPVSASAGVEEEPANV